MSKGKKIALGVVIFVVVILVGLAIVVPMLVDVDRYRPRVIAQIQEETGKPAEIGHLALTLFPTVSIRGDDFALGNPAGFPKGYFVKAQRIYAVVDARALWNRQVVITSLQLDTPVINLLSDARGNWNFENPTKPATVTKASASEPSLFSLGVISKVEITKGQLTAANLLHSDHVGPTYFEARNVSSQLAQVDLNAFISSGSTPATEARLKAASARSVASSLSQSFLEWTTLAYAVAPLPKPAAQGTLKADFLRFGSLQVTRLKSKVRLFPKQVFFDGVDFDLYGGHAAGDLSFNFAGQNARYSTNARLKGVNVAKLLEAFPDARGKMTGTMDGEMKLSGAVTHSPDPLAGMRGTGHVTVHNGQMPSVQLNKNLMLLARLSNLGPASGDPSSFSSISADLNIANDRLSSNKITVVGNGVEAEGSGSMSMAGEGSLDYEGLAKVIAGQNPITGILTGFSGATFADGKLSFPFTIGGTLQNPKFVLKSAAGGAKVGSAQDIMNRAAGQQGAQPGQAQPHNPAELVQGIVGLFKKKKAAEQPPQQPKP